MCPEACRNMFFIVVGGVGGALMLGVFIGVWLERYRRGP
jgi:hypothetical protein